MRTPTVPKHLDGYHNPIVLLPCSTVPSPFRQSIECMEAEWLEFSVRSAVNILADRCYKSPAERAWRNNKGALATYALLGFGYLAMLQSGRPIQLLNNETNLDALSIINRFAKEPTEHPWWLQLPAIERSHRSLLLYYDPGTYRPQWPQLPNNLPMFWPVAQDMTPVPY